MGGTRKVVDSQEIICPGNESAFFSVIFIEVLFLSSVFSVDSIN